MQANDRHSRHLLGLLVRTMTTGLQHRHYKHGAYAHIAIHSFLITFITNKLFTIPQKRTFITQSTYNLYRSQHKQQSCASGLRPTTSAATFTRRSARQSSAVRAPIHARQTHQSSGRSLRTAKSAVGSLTPWYASRRTIMGRDIRDVLLQSEIALYMRFATYEGVVTL